MKSIDDIYLPSYKANKILKLIKRLSKRYIEVSFTPTKNEKFVPVIMTLDRKSVV